MSVSTSALGGAHERGLSGGEQIVCIIQLDARWPGGKAVASLPSPFRHVLLGLTVLRFSCVLWVDKHLDIARTFSPAPRCEPYGITLALKQRAAGPDLDLITEEEASWRVDEQMVPSCKAIWVGR